MKAIEIGNPDCKKIRPSIDAYLSNELTNEIITEVLDHLGKCPECWRIFRIRELVKARLRLALRNKGISVGLMGRISKLTKTNGSWLERLFG
jgi:hypothetical protein